MHYLLNFALVILLTSCTSMKDNYYTQTVQSWQGGRISDLVKKWGTPDNKIIGPNGNTVYLYKTENYQAFASSASPAIGVNFNAKGKPIVTATPSTNFSWNRGMTLACVTLFIANRNNMIIDTQTEGRKCHGSKAFA